MKHILVFLLLVTAISCEEFSDSLLDDRYKLEGTWSCNETSEVFKSTNQVYLVDISVDTANDSRIWIEGFYNSIDVNATVSGNAITIPSQSSDGYTVLSGTGQINAKFDEITWEYQVDYGTGDPDNVTATYTK